MKRLRIWLGIEILTHFTHPKWLVDLGWRLAEDDSEEATDEK